MHKIDNKTRHKFTKKKKKKDLFEKTKRTKIKKKFIQKKFIIRKKGTHAKKKKIKISMVIIVYHF